MGDVHVIPSAPVTVEVLLRYLLERQGEYEGLVIASIGIDGEVTPWVTRGLRNCCISHASLVLQQEALDRGRVACEDWEDPAV